MPHNKRVNTIQLNPQVCIFEFRNALLTKATSPCLTQSSGFFSQFILFFFFLKFAQFLSLLSLFLYFSILRAACFFEIINLFL